MLDKFIKSAREALTNNQIQEGLHDALSFVTQGKKANPSLQAVAYFAQNAFSGKKYQKQNSDLDKLSSGDWETDFSEYVSRNDPLIQSRKDVRSIPKGAFIAFIYVDKPAPGATEGRRHLVHAMISLGDGKAAGYNNLSGISCGKNNDWGEIDLDQDLNWTTDNNSIDIVDRCAPNDTNSQLVRIRYCQPWQASQKPKQDTKVAEKPHWAWPTDPQRSNSLLTSLANAAASVTEIKFERGGTNPNYVRPSFVLQVTPGEYKKLFNDRHEMRGHYHAGGVVNGMHRGDHYTQHTLAELVPHIVWQNLGYTFVWFSGTGRNTVRHETRIPADGLIDTQHWDAMQNMPQSLLSFAQWTAFRSQLFNLIVHGKIWPDEGTKAMIEWPKKNDHFPPNLRWHHFSDEAGKRALFETNRQSFLDTNAVTTGLQTLNQRERDEFARKFETDAERYTFRWFGKFFSIQNAATAQHALIDVKGAWLDLSQAINNQNIHANPGTTPKKIGRAEQIEWFGMT